MAVRTGPSSWRDTGAGDRMDLQPTSAGPRPASHQAVRETEQAKKRVTKAIAVATKEVVKPGGRPQAPSTSSDGQRPRSGSGAPLKAAVAARVSDKPTPLAVNDPLAFISFIAGHRLGETLEGEVEGYTSHGAVVRVGEMRCYIPLANLGDPPREAPGRFSSVTSKVSSC